MTDVRTRASEILAEHPEWYHSIELAPGLVTPGQAPLEVWEAELRRLRLPDLAGKSVLDIGAYDGFFSFAAERSGAAKVVALDHYVWSCDMAGYMRDWRESQRTGSKLPPPHESRHWQPAALPGRRPFDAVRALFGSRVEPAVGDFMTMDLSALGRFDVILFLGVLYHLEDPLGALRRLARLIAPGGLVVIETEAVEIPCLRDVAACEFFPGRELNNDPTNWWAPNRRALAGMCEAAGFRNVTVLPASPRTSASSRLRGAFKSALMNVPWSNRRFRYRLALQAHAEDVAR